MEAKTVYIVCDECGHELIKFYDENKAVKFAKNNAELTNSKMYVKKESLLSIVVPIALNN